MYIFSFILFSVIVLYVFYTYRTRFTVFDAVIPQYEPYPGVKPMYMGVLLDGSLNYRDIIAGIMYLVQQGNLAIREDTEQKNRYLIFKAPFDEKNSDFERKLVQIIFGNTIPKIGAEVSFDTVSARIQGFWDTADGFGSMHSDLIKDMTHRGFYEENKIVSSLIIPLFIVIALTPIFSITIFLTSNEDVKPYILLSGIFCVFGLTMILVALKIIEKRRTTIGNKVLKHLKGFKDFLRVTERERYIFHNAPEKNAEQFMEYLPYAIAFGVEKEWVETFNSESQNKIYLQYDVDDFVEELQNLFLTNNSFDNK